MLAASQAYGKAYMNEAVSKARENAALRDTDQSLTAASVAALQGQQ
jgi:hypothetical protein